MIFSLLIREVRQFFSEKFRMKLLIYVHKPRKDFSSLTVVGVLASGSASFEIHLHELFIDFCIMFYLFRSILDNNFCVHRWSWFVSVMILHTSDRSHLCAKLIVFMTLVWCILEPSSTISPFTISPSTDPPSKKLYY